MAANIKLTRFISEDQALPDTRRQAWPVSILAEGIDIDDNIFVYHVGKADDPLHGDKFEAVASVNQMFELPKSQGVSVTLETGIPFYRHNVLEYVARSAEEAERIWKEVVKEVELLVRNWDSANRLRGADFAVITSDQTQTSVIEMNPPFRIQLSANPAGTPGLDGDVQIITAPDTTKNGWLPVSSVSPGIVVPPGAVFFYNKTQDVSLTNIWPPKAPFSGNLLYKNGFLLPYGIVYLITTDGLWWLDFDPATVPGYQRISPQAADGNAPWPINQLTPESGVVPTILILTIFK
jgi:hypothetical protein